MLYVYSFEIWNLDVTTYRMHLITITLSMPLLSRRRCAVSAISRDRKSQFCAKGVHQIEDEYIDIDDDRVSNFVNIDDDEGFDGFEIVFYPEYHCELNYIEAQLYWNDLGMGEGLPSKNVYM